MDQIKYYFPKPDKNIKKLIKDEIVQISKKIILS